MRPSSHHYALDVALRGPRSRVRDVLACCLLSSDIRRAFPAFFDPIPIALHLASFGETRRRCRGHAARL